MKKIFLTFCLFITPLLAFAKDHHLKTATLNEKGQTVVLNEGSLLILDGETATPKIQKIEAASSEGKPQLNVLTGMQAFENGAMKSYPHRISIKSMDPHRQKKPVLIQLLVNGKNIPLRVEFK